LLVVNIKLYAIFIGVVIELEALSSYLLSPRIVKRRCLARNYNSVYTTVYLVNDMVL